MCGNCRSAPPFEEMALLIIDMLSVTVALLGLASQAAIPHPEGWRLAIITIALLAERVPYPNLTVYFDVQYRLCFAFTRSCARTGPTHITVNPESAGADFDTEPQNPADGDWADVQHRLTALWALMATRRTLPLQEAFWRARRRSS